MLSLSDILVVALVGAIAFKWRTIPEIGKNMGRTISEFKKGLREDDKAVRDVNEPPKKN